MHCTFHFTITHEMAACESKQLISTTLTVSKEPTAKAMRKVQKLLSRHKTALPTDLKHKLTPYRSKTSRLYGLRKSHKPDIPLETYGEFQWLPLLCPGWFAHKILSHPAGKLESYVKNLSHFVQLLKSVNLQTVDTLISFNVVTSSC
jgi:hypothetical protein